MKYVRVVDGRVVDIFNSTKAVEWGDEVYAALWVAKSDKTEVEIGWVVDGQKFRAPDIDEVLAPDVRLSFLEFMDLFTEDEQLAIASAAMTDVATKLWYDRAVGAQFINLEDPRLEAGFQVLVNRQLVTAERRDRVLKGLPPIE